MNLAFKQDLSYLDLASFRKDLSDPQYPLRFRFFVEGLRCGRCVEKIEALNGRFAHVQSIRINLPAQQLEVDLANEAAPLSDVIAQVEALGFKASPLRNEEDLSLVSKKENQSELRRLGVAGLCATNIMMFSFALYFGASAEFKTFFEWLCLLIYLPVVTYVAWPFYSHTWSEAKAGRLSIDGPLAVASIAGFVFSTVNLLRGFGPIYYDSLAGFLFLILLSRFLQKRMQRKFLNYRTQMGLKSCFKARRVESPGVWAWVPSAELKVGDLVLVKKGEMIPTDSELVSENIQVDSSFFTGESKPVFKFTEMPVAGGTFLLSSEAQLRVQKTAEESDFGRLVGKVREGALHKTAVQNVSDRYATGLVIAVFALALLNVLFNFAGDLTESIERSLALIVLACPCAMAFGTPLALSFSLKRAFESGFLIKSADVFFKITKIKNVFLDKTGTVTGALQVTSVSPGPINKELAEIALGLEQRSIHPIAEALRKYLQPLGFRPSPVHELQNVPQGVAGFVDGKLYTLQGSDKITLTKSVALFHRGEALLHFNLVDPILDVAQTLIQKMKRRNLNLYLLSGDADAEVRRIGAALELSSQNTFSEMTAQSKADIIAKSKEAMMVGDGMNDSLALQNASVGVAVNGSIQHAMQSADVFLLSPNLEKLDELFMISEKAQRMIRRNLIISFVYNSVGAVAALLGFINPFVAAVLMPISSGFILFATWMGSRR
jgi:Cu2+-exporting ATPase/Cu+-exporting ATPase